MESFIPHIDLLVDKCIDLAHENDADEMMNMIILNIFTREDMRDIIIKNDCSDSKEAYAFICDEAIKWRKNVIDNCFAPHMNGGF